MILKNIRRRIVVLDMIAAGAITSQGFSNVDEHFKYNFSRHVNPLALELKEGVFFD